MALFGSVVLAFAAIALVAAPAAALAGLSAPQHPSGPTYIVGFDDRNVSAHPGASSHHCVSPVNATDIGAILAKVEGGRLPKCPTLLLITPIGNARVFYDLSDGSFDVDFRPSFLASDSSVPVETAASGNLGATADCDDCPPPTATSADCLVLLRDDCVANPFKGAAFAPADPLLP